MFEKSTEHFHIAARAQAMCDQRVKEYNDAVREEARKFIGDSDKFSGLEYQERLVAHSWSAISRATWSIGGKSHIPFHVRITGSEKEAEESTAYFFSILEYSDKYPVSISIISPDGDSAILDLNTGEYTYEGRLLVPPLAFAVFAITLAIQVYRDAK